MAKSERAKRSLLNASSSSNLYRKGIAENLDNQEKSSIFANENSLLTFNITQNAGEDGRANRLRFIDTQNENDRVAYKDALEKLRNANLSEKEKEKNEAIIEEISNRRQEQMTKMVNEALKGIDGVKVVDVRQGTGVYGAGVIEYTSSVDIEVEEDKKEAVIAVMSMIAEVTRQDSFIINYPNDYKYDELTEEERASWEYAANITVQLEKPFTHKQTSELSELFNNLGLGVTITGNEITASNFDPCIIGVDEKGNPIKKFLSDEEFYNLSNYIIESYLNGNSKTKIQQLRGDTGLLSLGSLQGSTKKGRGFWYQGGTSQRRLGYNHSKYSEADHLEDKNGDDILTKNGRKKHINGNGQITTQKRFFGQHYGEQAGKKDGKTDIPIQGTSIIPSELRERLKDTFAKTISKGGFGVSKNKGEFKSATENESVTEEAEDIRYRIIGEKGAERFVSFYTNKKNTSLENIVLHGQTARTEKVGVNDAAKLLQNVEKSYDNGKKVLDESETYKTLSEQSDEYSAEESNIRFSLVTDKALLNRLNSEETVKVYRAMQQVFDEQGKSRIIPPMAGFVDGKIAGEERLGEWYQSDEIDISQLTVDENKKDKDGNVYFIDKPNFRLHPTKTKGTIRQFWLKKEKGDGGMWVAYNPYCHTSLSPLNDQFTSAYNRPNMVVVECEIPKSELTSGYKAEGAKNSVGQTPWKSGLVSIQLPKGRERQVILSRYVKPLRVLSDAEVADDVMNFLDGLDVYFPSNVVTPSLLKELKSRGLNITDNVDENGKVIHNNLPKEYKNSGQLRYRKSEKSSIFANENNENYGTDETISTTERNDGQAIQPMERGAEQGNSLLELAEWVLTGRGRGYDTQSQRGVRSENGGRETDFDGERQEAAVEELAKELGVWHEEATEECEQLYGKKIGSGAESYVYLKDKDTVVKVRDITGYNSLQEALRSIAIHNQLFPKTAMTITGFGRSDGEFSIIFEQKHIENSTFATREQIAEYVAERFSGVLDTEVLGGNSYKSDDYLLQDLKPQNVLVAPDGELYVIDGDFYPNDRRTQSETPDAELTRFRKGRYGKNSSERLQGDWNAEKQAMLDEFGLNEVRLPASEYGRFATAIERWADSTPIRFKDSIIKSIEVYDEETGQIDLCTFIYKSSHRYVITNIIYNYDEQDRAERDAEEIYQGFDRHVQENNEQQGHEDLETNGNGGLRQSSSEESSGMDLSVRGNEQSDSNGRDDRAENNGTEISESETADQFRAVASDDNVRLRRGNIVSGTVHSLYQEMFDGSHDLNMLIRDLNEHRKENGLKPITIDINPYNISTLQTDVAEGNYKAFKGKEFHDLLMAYKHLIKNFSLYGVAEKEARTTIEDYMIARSYIERYENDRFELSVANKWFIDFINRYKEFIESQPQTDATIAYEQEMVKESGKLAKLALVFFIPTTLRVSTSL